VDFNRNIKINFNGGYLTSGSGILLYKEGVSFSSFVAVAQIRNYFLGAEKYTEITVCIG